MSTPGWRKNTAVTQKLRDAPYDYPFVQSVRLLERSARLQTESSSVEFSMNPVGSFSPPASESIRFTAQHSLSFPGAEISSIEQRKSTSSTSTSTVQWQVKVNMIGLAGAMGVLPYHYSELILNRQKLKDHTLEHFLNLFNHRSTSLYYQASCKYRLALQYERHRLYQADKEAHDNVTHALLALTGLGTRGLLKRLHTADESLAFYSGLFSQKVRTSSGLQQILRTHFNIPVKIEQFIGQWQELIKDVRTRLPDPHNPNGRNACLGRSAMLGKKGWYAQGKVQIILGPLNLRQLEQFAPGTDTLKALNEMVRLYVGMEQSYEFIIRINKADIPERIRMSRQSPPVMGWNTWLSKKSAGFNDDSETMDISVSASRLG